MAWHSSPKPILGRSSCLLRSKEADRKQREGARRGFAHPNPFREALNRNKIISAGASLFFGASHKDNKPDKSGMEESPNSTSSTTNLYKPSSKRLLFDRRYGWVIDEWKDPSKEALEGGRGMFCILPLARALVQRASQSINLSATLATKASQNPQWFCHQNLQAAFDDGLRNFLSLKNAACKLNIVGKNSPPDASNISTESRVESKE